MRATKAKALRRAVGFKPSAPREFSHDHMIEKTSIVVNGRPTRYVVTGTVIAAGARRQYQAVKRRRGMADIVLGAGRV